MTIDEDDSDVEGDIYIEPSVEATYGSGEEDAAEDGGGEMFARTSAVGNLASRRIAK